MTDTTKTGGDAPNPAKQAGTQGANGANATDAVATGAEAPSKHALPAGVPPENARAPAPDVTQTRRQTR